MKNEEDGLVQPEVQDEMSSTNEPISEEQVISKEELNEIRTKGDNYIALIKDTMNSITTKPQLELLFTELLGFMLHNQVVNSAHGASEFMAKIALKNTAKNLSGVIEGTEIEWRVSPFEASVFIKIGDAMFYHNTADGIIVTDSGTVCSEEDREAIKPYTDAFDKEVYPSIVELVKIEEFKLTEDTVKELIAVRKEVEELAMEQTTTKEDSGVTEIEEDHKEQEN